MICRILKVARSTAYYREHDRAVIVDEVLAQRIKHLIDAEPYLGYRMVFRFPDQIAATMAVASDVVAIADATGAPQSSLSSGAPKPVSDLHARPRY